MIPASVIIAAKNEQAQIERCLDALTDFDEIIVVDSNSYDKTCELAAAKDARIENFTWNGQYPKKRQWCLDNLAIKHDWVFFVDADEVVTPELVEELKMLFKIRPEEAGFFIRGRYVIDGKEMRFGLHNNKLCLLNRHKMEFPVINDLDCPGMGEIEGHYQPVLKDGVSGAIGQIGRPLLHYAYDGGRYGRHERYAQWEVQMNRHKAWPQDPVWWRQQLKCLFRNMPGRPLVAFMHCYILKLGFLDGKTGFLLARDRFRYYRMITRKQSVIN